MMLAISLTIACSRYTYDGVILPAHPFRGESHNQRNTTGEVATLPVKVKKRGAIKAVEQLSPRGWLENNCYVWKRC